MRSRYPRFVAVILIGMLTAGCGTRSAAARPADSGGTLPAGPSAGSGQQSGGELKRRAAADARSILSEFAPPPGAARLAAAPKLPGGSPVMGLMATTRVDAIGYWRVNGSATDLRAWEKAHISRAFSRQDVIMGPPSWSTLYSLPAVPGALPTREMNVQFYDADGGATVIMADAMVSWQPPRPPAERIPDSATVVTIAAAGMLGGDPKPVTITSATVVRRIAALVNGLPVSTRSGVRAPCPLGGPGVRLTFRAVVQGPVVAIVAPGGCGALTVWITGKDQPDLQAPESYATAIVKIAGLSWDLRP